MTDAADFQQPVAPSDPPSTDRDRPPAVPPPVPIMDAEDPFPELHVTLEVVSGRPLPPARIPGLITIYRELNMPFDRSLWLLETPDGALFPLRSPGKSKPVTHPMEAGYRQVSLPAPLAAALQGIGRLAATLPGIRIQGETLILPNGARRSLTPMRWQDMDGKPANIYRVKRLPDHRWLRIDDIKPGADYPFEDKKALKTAIEQEVSVLEATGLARVASPPAMPPADPPPATTKPPIVPTDGAAPADNPFSVTA